MSPKQGTYWTAAAAAPLAGLAAALLAGLLAATAIPPAHGAAGVVTSIGTPTAAASSSAGPLPNPAVNPSLSQSATPTGAPTAAPGKATAKVNTDGAVLKVRSGPATDKRTVTSLADGSTVTVRCQSWGESVTGVERSSPYWNRIGAGQYVGDAFVRWSSARAEVPWCGVEPVDATRAQVVTDGSVLNVRSGPGTKHRLVGAADAGAALPVRCQSWGEEIRGQAKTSVWAQVGEGRYVSDAFIGWQPQRPWLPWCGQEAPSIPAATSAAFISRAALSAQAGQRQTGVPSSVTLAQAILESGWGRSRLARDDHNIFGMKCFTGPGPIALGCRDYSTSDCDGGSCRATRARFRGYRDETDSYLDHGRQLSTLSRYAVAMAHTDDPDVFVREIHKAGYATGTNYSTKVIDLMKQYDLYQYDVQP